MRVEHRRARKFARAIVLLAGLLLPQLVLLGPSLLGSSVALPLDALASGFPALYGERFEPISPLNANHSDMLFHYEPFRRYAVGELHAGRIPLWLPHIFGGTSFIGIGQTAFFSPYRLIEFSSMNPIVLAWSQLAKALVAGLGMYFFLRIGLRVRFVAALCGAWFYPLTGFLTLWAGFPMMAGISWMPWMLLATEMSIRRNRLRWPALISVMTCFCVFGGHLQVVGHAMLLSGLYAVFRAGNLYWNARSKIAAALSRCALGWTLGLMLSSIQFVPMMEYLVNSARLQLRQGGTVERESLGFASAPLLLNPWLGGERREGTEFLFSGSNRQESTAAGYAGLLLTCVAGPLAWRSRRRRAHATFWAAVTVFAVAQVLGIPLLKQLTEAPPLGMLSSNRMTCLAGFALTILAAFGIEAMSRRRGYSLRVRLAIMLTLIACAIVFLVRIPAIPQFVGDHLNKLTQFGYATYSPTLRATIFEWFIHQYLLTAGLLFLAAFFFMLLSRATANLRLRQLVLGAFVLAAFLEMTLTASTNYNHCDRRLYPQEPAIIARLKQHGPGRLLGFETFMPNLALWWNVDTINGYDGLDPLPITQLLLADQPKEIPSGPSYGRTLTWIPRFDNHVLELLGVRFLATSAPLPGLTPIIRENNLFIYERPVMPPVYVPKNVSTINEPAARLAAIVDPAFEPAETAIVESKDSIALHNVNGQVAVVNSVPGAVELKASMTTPGLVVLTQALQPGWHAIVNGAPAVILRTNHAFTGVVLPAGESKVELRFEPASLRLGALFSGLTLFLLAAMLVIDWMWAKKMPRSTTAAPLN